jgi:hypothetical protein
MQGVDPSGVDENPRVMNKVCAVNFFSFPSLTAHPPMVQTSHAASAMSLLESFGLGGLVQSLLAEGGVHRLGNLLSLEPNCHGYFDKLQMWFEHTEEVRRLLAP